MYKQQRLLLDCIYELRHEISNNVVCAYPQSDQSLCLSIKYTTSVTLLTEKHLEFLAFKEDVQARLRLHMSKYHIVGNHMLQLICPALVTQQHNTKISCSCSYKICLCVAYVHSDEMMNMFFCRAHPAISHCSQLLLKM